MSRLRGPRRGPRDDAGFAEFVVAEYGALRRYAYLLAGNQADAEDLVQAALTKAVIKWSDIIDRQAAGAYVRTTMVRLRYNENRRLGRERASRSKIAVRPGEDATQTDFAAEIEERDRVWQALATLSPKQRAVVVLRFHDDLSEQVTADLLNCPVGTVKSIASRSLQLLRDLPLLQPIDEQ